MIGIRRALEVRHVAGRARRIGQVVIVVDVATGARRRGVGAGEGKPAGSVIKINTKPRIHTVTQLAIRGEACSRMIWIRRAPKILGVTRITLGREALKLSSRASRVARFAGNGRMGAEQRKAILVILDGLYGNAPSLHGVALLAIRAQLPAMDIRVAVRALCTDVAEDKLDVTIDAVDFFVHSPERKAGGVVAELRGAPDGLPTCKGVAVFAGNRDIAVRVAGGRARGRPLLCHRHGVQGE